MALVTASTSYLSRVLAGLMSEAEFFSFLATYAVPADRANPIGAMRERWAASARGFAALEPYVPAPLHAWHPGWGDPETLSGRPGMRSLTTQHADLAFGAAPVEALVVHHPSLDLEQADFWAGRLANLAGVVAPERNDAPATWAYGEEAQSLTVRAAYALLGAYLSAEPQDDSPLPKVRVNWQPGINLVQVGRLGDRLLLVNGHHRAYALARAGAKVIPCVSYSIPDLEIVGISPGSHSEATLLSATPPRLPHFLDPVLAVLVQLRRSTRTVTLAIAEETIQER